MPRLFHIVQGRSAAGCFLQALRPPPGELLVSEDVLSCGPLPPFQSFEQWTSVRHEFWHSVAPDIAPLLTEYEGHAADAATLRDAESIIAWLGTGIAEQLLLAWLLQVLRATRSRAKLSVVQFSRIGEHNRDVWGLGLLNPEQIKRHPPIHELSSDRISELDRCWRAITSPNPAGLMSVLSGELAAPPHLHAGLQMLVRRYPDHQMGLGRWDLDLLKATDERGPRTLRVIGHTLGENFDADLVGDAYLFWRLRRLGSPVCAQPLVRISGDPSSIRTCEVALTDAGRSVLEGRINAVDVNGINEWVLGVHLSSERGTVWYQKDGAIVLRR